MKKVSLWVTTVFSLSVRVSPKGILKKCIAVLFIVLALASTQPCGKWDLGGDVAEESALSFCPP